MTPHVNSTHFAILDHNENGLHSNKLHAFALLSWMVPGTFKTGEHFWGLQKTGQKLVSGYHTLQSVLAFT